MLGVSNSFLAYSLDRAAYAFGTRLESELSKIENSDKSKAQKAMAEGHLLRKWLGIEPPSRGGAPKGPTLHKGAKGKR